MEKQYKLVSNKIKCLKCGDIIESKYIHDFKWCSCGAIFVDGGLSYQRCGGEGLHDYEDLSVWVEIEEN